MESVVGGIGTVFLGEDHSLFISMTYPFLQLSLTILGILCSVADSKRSNLDQAESADGSAAYGGV